MKNFLLVSIISAIYLGLSGCGVYSSVNGAYIKSDNVTVLGPWGYCHTGINSSILLYRAMNVCGSKIAKAEFVGWPVMPNIQEDANSNLNIGKPTKALPTATTKITATETAPGVEQAAAMITK
jgi:hypothetical protein